MKSHSIALFLLLFFSLLYLSEDASAQDKSYTEGSVWQISFVKTKRPYFDDYLTNLSNGWKKVMEEAKSEGLVISYKVLSSPAGSAYD